MGRSSKSWELGRLIAKASCLTANCSGLKGRPLSAKGVRPLKNSVIARERIGHFELGLSDISHKLDLRELEFSYIDRAR